MKSRHGINPAGLAQAVTLSRNANADLHIVIYYSETADAIRAQMRRPGEPLRTPSTFQFVSMAAREMTAAEIIADIDAHIDLLTELPF